MGRNSSGSDFVVGAVIGGLIGAATALFLAPKSGKELRADFNESTSSMNGFKSLAEKGTELAGAAKERTISLSQVVAEQSSGILDIIKEVTSQQKGEDSITKNEPAGLLDEVKNLETDSQADFIPLNSINENKEEF